MAEIDSGASTRMELTGSRVLAWISIARQLIR